MLTRFFSGLVACAPLRRLLAILAVVLAIREFVWTPVLITGNSMLPTLHSGQITGLNKLAYLRRRPQRGEIVAVWTGKELMIKRIVGLPGESIGAKDGTMWINGAPLQEPYIRFHDHWNIDPGTIAAGQFVVAGDNRSETLIAVVSRDRIIGRLVR